MVNKYAHTVLVAEPRTSGAQLQRELKAEYERQVREAAAAKRLAAEAREAGIEATPEAVSAYVAIEASLRAALSNATLISLMGGVEALVDNGTLSRRQGRALLQVMDERGAALDRAPATTRLLSRYLAAPDAPERKVR